MSTLVGIDAAAKTLLIEEHRELLISLASRHRAEPGSLPEPRVFAPKVIRSWVQEDQADMKTP